MSDPPEPEPELENSRNAGIRDVVLGTVLLGIGVFTGASTLSGSVEHADIFFDVLGSALVLWGSYRIVRSR